MKPSATVCVAVLLMSAGMVSSRAQSNAESKPSQKPMAADADPVFAVASIKPSPTGPRNKGIRIVGHRLSGTNQTVSDLIGYSYGVQRSQISGGPQWLESELFDVLAEPDGEGQPSNQQWTIMVQKLLTDRFKLAFHREKKEMSVFTLALAKGGPKLTPSADDPNGFPSFASRLGNVVARNANMDDFAGLMQYGLDRPVLNQTGLTGKFDFDLNWTPDDFQLAVRGIKPPPIVDPDKAPPNQYIAIQEQLGLKLESTKAPADVLVIDHVEEPSPN